MEIEDKIKKIDEMLDNLIELAHTESIKSKQKGFFSKDLAESCCVIASIVYGRYGNNDK